MPLNDQKTLHMSAGDVATIRTRLDDHGPMLALRFEEDRLCRHAKFDALRDKGKPPDESREQKQQVGAKG